VVVPRLLQVAIEEGWWSPLASAEAQPVSAADATGEPTIVATVDAETWSRLTLVPRVIAPADPAAGHAIVAAALRGGGSAVVSAAVVGSTVVGLAVSAPEDPSDGAHELLALGVAPDYRRRGIATALLTAHVGSGSSAVVTLAERDPIDPLPRDVRASTARRLLERAGFEVAAADDDVRSIDPAAFTARKR
jgi:ribosomal protein S18 acetylase RimI-like enzyme